MATRVAYVGGAGRSGSTLLDCMLGELPGVVSCGEITHLWRRGGVENQLCGCERPFLSCPFWTRVVEEAYGSVGGVDFRAMAELRDRVCRSTNLPALIHPSLRTKTFNEALTHYRINLIRLYEAILSVSEASVLVDSSKYPFEAFLLGDLQGVQPVIFHILRDPVAVSHAWQKRKKLPEVHWEDRYYARYFPGTTALAWSVFNPMVEMAARRGHAYLRVRYEDLVAKPKESLQEAAALLGLSDVDWGFLGAERVRFKENHTVSGNSSRFSRGWVPLRLNVEWRDQTSVLQKLLVDLLTWPGRSRYGYPAGRGESGKD